MDGDGWRLAMTGMPRGASGLVGSGRARMAGCGPGARYLVTPAYEITCPNKAHTVL